MTDQHKPGPALNAAVARAIGWPYREWKDKRGRECCAWEPTTGGTIAPGLWRPSTDIADAMRAAVEMEPRGFTWGVLRRNNLASTRAFFIGPKAELTHADVNLADTNGDRLAALCLAICRAIVEAGR